MAHAVVAWGNMADRAVLSGPAFVSTLPLANVQDRTLGNMARTINTDPANTWFDIDLLSDELVRVIALINHNGALSGQFRIIGSRTPDFATLAHDSGWSDQWPAVFATSSLEWEMTNFWDGRYRDKDRQGQTWKLVYLLPEARFARYWRVEIRDTSGGNAFFQFGRLFISGAWQPVRNIIYDGFGLGITTDTRVRKTLSGDDVFDRRNPKRTGRFTTAAMTEDEAFANAFEIMTQMGIDGEILYIVDPDDTVHAMRRQIYGTLVTLSDLENPYAIVDGYRTTWAVKGV